MARADNVPVQSVSQAEDAAAVLGVANVLRLAETDRERGLASLLAAEIKQLEKLEDKLKLVRDSQFDSSVQSVSVPSPKHGAEQEFAWLSMQDQDNEQDSEQSGQ